MSDTMWFDRTKDSIGGDVHISQGSEDPTAILMTGANVLPDWVRTPAEIGGEKLKVIGSFQQECPICRSGQSVRHMECSGGLFVAECSTHGFAWYSRK